MPAASCCSTSRRVCRSNAALQRVRRACWAGARPGTPAASIRWPPACCRSASARPPRWQASCSPGDKCYTLHACSSARAPHTGDAEGEVVERAPVPTLGGGAVAARRWPRFIGPQLQVPPMYSALKRDGQPLYKLARRGHRGRARAARRSRIHELELLELGGRDAGAAGRCAPRAPTCARWPRTWPRPWAPAGTWRRCGATSSSPSAASRWCTLEQLQAGRLGQPTGCCAADRRPAALRRSAARCRAQARALRHGQAVATGGRRRAPGLVRLYDADGRFMGLGERHRPTAGCGPRRLFATVGSTARNCLFRLRAERASRLECAALKTTYIEYRGYQMHGVVH